MTRAGDGMRLCLLPGLDGTGRLYAPLIQAFGDAVEVEPWTYDSGHFDSYAALADAFEPTMRRHADIVLVAESFAGPLAIMLAQRHPVRVRAVVLAASFVHRPLPASTLLANVLQRMPAIAPPVFALERLLAGEGMPPDLRKELDLILDAIPVDVLRRRALAALRVDVRDELAGLTMPLLYLQAGHDRLIRPRAGRDIARLARNARWETIPAPHFLFQLAPVEAAAAIRRFLRQIR